jgi:hypothetical protein
MSEWMDFVKKVRRDNPKLSYKQALQKASSMYNKKKGTKGATNISRVKEEKKKGEGDTMDFTTKRGDKLKTGPRKGQQAFARPFRHKQKSSMTKSSY